MTRIISRGRADITRRRERSGFGHVSATTVLYLNRLKINGEGANSSDLGTIYALLIIEETTARLCLTREE